MDDKIKRFLSKDYMVRVKNRSYNVPEELRKEIAHHVGKYIYLRIDPRDNENIYMYYDDEQFKLTSTFRLVLVRKNNDSDKKGKKKLL